MNALLLAAAALLLAIGLAADWQGRQDLQKFQEVIADHAAEGEQLQKARRAEP